MGYRQRHWQWQWQRTSECTVQENYGIEGDRVYISKRVLPSRCQSEKETYFLHVPGADNWNCITAGMWTKKSPRWFWKTFIFPSCGEERPYGVREIYKFGEPSWRWACAGRHPKPCDGNTSWGKITASLISNMHAMVYHINGYFFS